MNGAKCITYRMRIKKSTHEDANRAVISLVVGVERLVTVDMLRFLGLQERTCPKQPDPFGGGYR